MTGMDASFFYGETPEIHMHVVAAILLDPSTMPNGYSYDAIRKVFDERLHLVPQLRRRPMFVPFGLGHPVWIDDQAFDLDRHVRRVACPAPGTMRELAELIGHESSIQLDRGKPLWEVMVVEGLEHGQVAIVTKVHHSAIDGVSGADVLVRLVDLEPEPQPVEAPDEEWKPEVSPTELELAARSFVRQFARPQRVVRTMMKTAAAARRITAQLTAGTDAALPLTAPETILSGALTPHRTVAFGRASLDDLKAIKNAFGTTVNDVVLAASTEALRRYLADHDDLPDKPLIASIPVSVRTEDQQGELGNRVSSMFAKLPVQLDDPVAQLRDIHRRMNSAKELHNAIGADFLQDWTEVMGPGLFTRFSRLYSRRLAGRHRPIHNVVVSNVPGPPFPLYVGGARITAIYPMGPVIFGAGLNLTVLSNMGNVDLAAVGCTELVPDIWDIPEHFQSAIAELKIAADKA
ncbi:MAG: WS/DGAT/MGAT family O-acyltransferase [Acidimicrobiales bacterium]